MEIVTKQLTLRVLAEKIRDPKLKKKLEELIEPGTPLVDGLEVDETAGNDGTPQEDRGVDEQEGSTDEQEIPDDIVEE